MHRAPTTVTPTAQKLAEILTEPAAVDQESLAVTLNVSSRSVRRALADLEALGIVRRERRHDAAGHRLADSIVPTGQKPLSSMIKERAVTHRKRRPVGLPIEVEQLRAAMHEAGIECSWGNLRDDVIADLVRWVRTIGIRGLVEEAKRRIWSPVIRHVAAFLRFWRELRPAIPRRVVCPFHPAESTDRGRRCPACADERSKAVPMPADLRSRFRRRRVLPSS